MQLQISIRDKWRNACIRYDGIRKPATPDFVASSCAYFNRTPGLLPLVNSTPAFSSAAWIASTVRG